MGNPAAPVKLIEYRLAHLPALRARSRRGRAGAARTTMSGTGRVSCEYRHYPDLPDRSRPLRARPLPRRRRASSR